MTIEVTDAPEAKRFEARVDGKLAGFIQYQARPEALVLVHTQVLEEFEGKGVGSVLARRVLDDIRARGGKIIPTCPFVAEYIRRHPEYIDVVAPAFRAAVSADSSND
jgi:predicted GNAT family acetyltransferase